MALYLPMESRTLAELLRWDTKNPTRAPFIKIGQLLLAVDQTGCEARQPLINALKAQYQASKFTLYSGRHGALERCFQDNGLVPASASARDFYDDDLREAARFAPLAGVDIDVVDPARLPRLLYKQRVLTDSACGQGGNRRLVPFHRLHDHDIESHCAGLHARQPTVELRAEYDAQEGLRDCQ